MKKSGAAKAFLKDSENDKKSETRHLKKKTFSSQTFICAYFQSLLIVDKFVWNLRTRNKIRKFFIN